MLESPGTNGKTPETHPERVARIRATIERIRALLLDHPSIPKDPEELRKLREGDDAAMSEPIPKMFPEDNIRAQLIEGGYIPP
jgi:hypothetical protein